MAESRDADHERGGSAPAALRSRPDEGPEGGEPASLEAALRRVRERQAGVLSSVSRFGGAGRLFKGAVRRLIRFYTERQKEFNEATADALDQVRAELDTLGRGVEGLGAQLEGLRAQTAAGQQRLESDVMAQGRHLDDLTGRLVHFAKAVSAAQADARDVGEQVPRLAEDLRARLSAIEHDLRPDLSLDHFDFARRFRGDEARIQERMQRYARMFGAVRRVVDLGCGRGEFVRACNEVGVGAYGIDSDPDMVSHCELQGLEVGQGDIFAHLSSLEDRSLDGIFSAQVIEHLTPTQIADLVQLAADKLKRGALFVAETIDPNTFSALRWYHLDLTHRQPVPSETLAYLLERAGFEVRDVLPLSTLEESEQLAHLPEPGEGEDPAGLVAVYNRNVDRLNQILFGPQDYAVVAER